MRCVILETAHKPVSIEEIIKTDHMRTDRRTSGAETVQNSPRFSRVVTATTASKVNDLEFKVNDLDVALMLLMKITTCTDVIRSTTPTT